MATKKTTNSAQEWMDMMEEWFAKLLPLPKEGTDALVTITPWIALIFGILGIMAGVSGLGLFTAFSPFMAMGGYGHMGGAFITSILGIIASVLLLLGFPGTQAHKMQGWKMLFWSEMVNVLAAVVAISLNGVLVGAIGLYLLFQIKNYYK